MGKYPVVGQVEEKGIHNVEQGEADVGHEGGHPAHAGPCHHHRQTHQQDAAFEAEGMGDAQQPRALVGLAAGEAPFDPVEAGVVGGVPEGGDQRQHEHQAGGVHEGHVRQPHEGRGAEHEAADLEEGDLAGTITQVALDRFGNGHEEATMECVQFNAPGETR